MEKINLIIESQTEGSINKIDRELSKIIQILQEINLNKVKEIKISLY